MYLTETLIGLEVVLEVPRRVLLLPATLAHFSGVFGVDPPKRKSSIKEKSLTNMQATMGTSVYTSKVGSGFVRLSLSSSGS
jgi:hypothetical protein